MKKLLALLILSTSVFATTLSGSFKNPDLTGVTGTLYLSVTQQGAVSSAGGCPGPFQVVPTYQIPIKVTNGTVTSTVVVDTACIAPAGIQYNAILVDSGGNKLFQDVWQITGTTQDVGNVQDTAINVALASPVITVGKDDRTGQTAAYGPVTLYTATLTGFYRVSGFMILRTAPASGSLSVTMQSNDGFFTLVDGSAAFTTTGGYPFGTGYGNGASGVGSDVWLAAGQSLTYTVLFNTVTGSPVFDLHIRALYIP